MMLERTQVVTTIRAFGEELTKARSIERTAKLEVSERGMEADALSRACAASDVREEDLRATIDADPTLVELEEAVKRDALAGSPDPGPYDAISRESPSGSTENRHLGAYGAAAVGEPVTPGGEGPKTP